MTIQEIAENILLVLSDPGARGVTLTREEALQVAGFVMRRLVAESDKPSPPLSAEER